MHNTTSQFKKLLPLLLFIQLFITSALFAEESCYSVQLASVYNKNSIYFNENIYPSECKIISLTNLKAVRCGCFQKKEQARAALKNLRSSYHGAILVKTFRSRFENKLNIKNQAKQRQGLENITPQKEDSTSEEKDSTTQEDSTLTEEDSTVQKSNIDEGTSFEKSLSQENLAPSFVENLLNDGDFSVSGNVDLTAQYFIDRPAGKHSTNLTGSGTLDFEYTKNDVSVIAKMYAQADAHDTQGSSSQNDRTFIRLDELYIKNDFEDDQIMFGKSIRFWGALEVRNIADVFNPYDLRSDIFNSQKLGVWNAAYTHFTETGELSIIVKLNEPDRKMPNFPYVYYFLPEKVEFPAQSGSVLPLNYDDNLIKQLANRPTFFIRYSGSTDTDYPLDYSIMYQNGYDSQRYFTYTKSATAITARENVQSANKIITSDTLVVGSTLLKFEGTYTDITNPDDINTLAGKVKKISDYYQLGVGFEHTLTQVNGEADLGLLSEYYRYETINKGDKYYNDLDLFEIFQNDLFVGARYSFNEGNDASILAGVLYDLDYNEEVYSIEYESRIADIFKLKIDYDYMSPSDTEPTAYHLMGQSSRISANLGYYF